MQEAKALCAPTEMASPQEHSVLLEATRLNVDLGCVEGKLPSWKEENKKVSRQKDPLF